MSRKKWIVWHLYEKQQITHEFFYENNVMAGSLSLWFFFNFNLFKIFLFFSLELFLFVLLAIFLFLLQFFLINSRSPPTKCRCERPELLILITFMLLRLWIPPKLNWRGQNWALYLYTFGSCDPRWNRSWCREDPCTQIDP